MGADVARTLTGQYRVFAHEGGHPFTQRPTSVGSETGVPGAIPADEPTHHRRLVPATLLPARPRPTPSSCHKGEAFAGQPHSCGRTCLQMLSPLHECAGGTGRSTHQGRPTGAVCFSEQCGHAHHLRFVSSELLHKSRAVPRQIVGTPPAFSNLRKSAGSADLRCSAGPYSWGCRLRASR